MSNRDYIEERLPPHSVEAEEAILGSILIDNDIMLDVGDRLTPAMFYRPVNRKVYEAMAALHARREPIDLLTLGDELNRVGGADLGGDFAYLVKLLNAVPTSINADYYANMVAEKATRRHLLAMAGAMAKSAYDESAPVADTLAQAERELIAARPDTKGTVWSAHHLAAAGLDELMAEDAPPLRFVDTGLADLDAMLGGLHAPHQYVIAGRTSMGKSSLALTIILDAIMNQRKRVMLFSLEMGERQIRNRLISMMTNIPAAALMRPDKLDDSQRRAMTAALGQLSDMHFHLDCSPGLRPGDIRARATRQHLETGLDMVIVDHLHIMRPDQQERGRNRARELGDTTLSLAETYKMLDVTGLTLAQLNREVENRAVKRPALSDLRDSGEIEENAYAVIMLHRDGYYDPMKDPNVADALVVKNRDGATGQVNLFWNGKLAMFRNLAYDELNPPRANGRVSTPPARQGAIVL